MSAGGPGFFSAPCPSCGAPVHFASAAGAFAVCAHCGSSLARDGEVLAKLGTMSELLEDFSPLQVGAGGTHAGRPFTVVGRIQLTHERGLWNEWWLVFADGGTGWLTDADGQWTIFTAESREPVPAHAALKPGATLKLGGETWTVADWRVARCTSAQGELPFPVHARWEAPLADLRLGQRYATADYSGPTPVMYIGESVTREALALQNLRSDDLIVASAGRLRGKLEALACPACGATLRSAAGLTRYARCPSCGSQLDLGAAKAQLLERGQRAESRWSEPGLLRPGDKGTLLGTVWTVLGAIEQAANSDGETFTWIEYLLYNPAHGLRWLSKGAAEPDWSFGQPLAEWPVLVGERAAVAGASFMRNDAYRATVRHAWGSLPARAARGDVTDCVEYRVRAPSHGAPSGSVLVRETTAHEQAWTLCLPLRADQVEVAFGLRARVRQGAKGKPQAAAALPARTRPTLVTADDDDGLPAFMREAAFWGGFLHLFLWLDAPTRPGFVFLLLFGAAWLIAWLWSRERDA